MTDSSASGMDARVLARLPQEIQPFIDRGELSGIICLTWRRGAIVQAEALGFRDLDSRDPVRRDTLFRIASMTKPITTVAALMLMEEGKLGLDDPVSRWLPQLAEMRVLRRADGPVDDTVAADRPITVEDLMTHRSGIAYGKFSAGPIAGAYQRVLGDSQDNGKTPDEWLAALGSLPLVYQPGERMHYGQSTDVLGFLVARIEKKSLAALLEERIFAPLGMKDTGFFVSPERRDRLATLYDFGHPSGKPAVVNMPSYEKSLSYRAGGSGLVSTADDYLAFARMLLNDGEVDGVRLLAPKTVRLMRTNRLTAAQRQFPFVGAPTWAGMGFGLGLGIVDVPEKNLLGCGRSGSFTWPGAYGTWWQADPVEDLVMICMFQHMPPFTPDAGATIAGGRGMAGRMALPVYQKLTYEALKG